MKKLIGGIALSLVAAGLLAGCGNEGSNDFVFGVNPATAQPVASPSPATSPAAPVVTDVQVEQLARPAVNEGTLVTNKFLNTYNAVGPDFIAAALANSTSPQAQAAGPVLAEAVADLIVVASVNNATGFNATNYVTNGIVPALLPDVMRIDTTLNVAVNATAYNAKLNAKNSPVGGRKITDDVVDITLFVLTGGLAAPSAAIAPATATTPGGDNVPYYRPASGPGSTNPNIGHQNLNGQTTQFGPATFPYLAPAN